MPDTSPISWIDQFVLRENGPGGVLAPFTQAVSAADLLVSVAGDRTGLRGPSYDAVGVSRFQAALLADFVRRLESDFSAHVRSAERFHAGPVGEADPSGRARTLMAAMTGCARTYASLVETCHALLEVAGSLLVIQRPRSRIDLVAAVGALRGSAGSAQVCVQVILSQITDAVTFDRLAAGIASAEHTITLADRLWDDLRSTAAPGHIATAQRRHDSLFDGQASL